MKEPQYVQYVLRRPLEIPYEIDKSYSVHLDLETFFVPLDVSRLSTDIEQELVQLHLDSECEGTGIGRIITQEDIRAIAERIVGLLTQPQKEQKGGI